MTRGAERVIRVYEHGRLSERPDTLSIEEPLEIRVNGQAISITMRTPGHDAELAAGFLYGEGLLKDLTALTSVSPVLAQEGDRQNVVAVETTDPIDTERLKRSFYATSSCGVCGKSSLKALKTLAVPIESRLRVSPEWLLTLPDQLKAAQATFARTGSLHATGIFEANGALRCAYEDVGRHNAVDKAIGHHVLTDAMPLDQAVMLVSGRTSFEILQKAVMARIPVVAAISGPSSLAVSLAEEFGVTLVGFLRGGRFNVYSHAERLAEAPSV